MDLIIIIYYIWLVLNPHLVAVYLISNPDWIHDVKRNLLHMKVAKHGCVLCGIANEVILPLPTWKCAAGYLFPKE